MALEELVRSLLGGGRVRMDACIPQDWARSVGVASQSTLSISSVAPWIHHPIRLNVEGGHEVLGDVCSGPYLADSRQSGKAHLATPEWSPAEHAPMEDRNTEDQPGPASGTAP